MASRGCSRIRCRGHHWGRRSKRVCQPSRGDNVQRSARFCPRPTGQPHSSGVGGTTQPGRAPRLGLTAQVRPSHSTGESVLWVPSEAVIRTGRRALVCLLKTPVAIARWRCNSGRKAMARRRLVKGLTEGQKVVTSGQFLLDSEASLKGIVASAEEDSPLGATASSFHEADGQIVEINDKDVTLAHGPFKTLGMPGMTMTFSRQSGADAGPQGGGQGSDRGEPN